MKQNKYEMVAWDVDTQRDFMEGIEVNGYAGKLALPNAMEIENNLSILTKYLREKNIAILGSVDWHNKDAKEFAENPDFMRTFPQHCVKNTYGAQNIDATKKLNPMYIDWDRIEGLNGLIEKVRKHDGETIFRKDDFDVFRVDRDGIGNPYARAVVKELGIKKAFVYGVATDVCVDYAVEGLRRLGVEVYAIKDCMRGINEENIKAKINNWQQGINPAKIVRLEEILEGKVN